MKEMKICLTFICRDNETVINRMIDSCLFLVDEIIACDTGSTDKTIGKIDSYCNKIPTTIRRHEWKNFGHNRTLMMQEASKSKCDYILVMDSDEELIVNGDFKKESLFADIMLIQTISGSMKYNRDRIFKNSHIWKWIGYAHEYPHSDTFNTKQHDGLLQLKLFPKNGNSHIIRNYKLLLQEKKDGIATSRTHFYLGQSSKDLGLREEAIEHYENCLETSIWNQERFIAYYDLGKLYKLEKDYNSAEAAYLKGFEELPERIETLYSLAVMLREQKMYNQAMIYLEYALGVPMPKDGLFVDWSIYKYKIEFEMSICCYWIGNYERAFICCEKVAQTIEDNKIEDLGTILQNQKNMSYIKIKLHKKDNPKINLSDAKTI